MQKKKNNLGVNMHACGLDALEVWHANVLLVLCALFWGLGFVGMRTALEIYPTFWLLFFRFAGGTLLMAATFFRRIVAASRSDISGGALIGIFLFFGMGTQTWGLNYTTVGKQAFISGTYVIMVPLILWGLRRIFPGRAVILSALACFAGLGLLGSDVVGALNKGDALTLVSAMFYAGHILAIGYYVKDGDPFVLVFVQFLVTAVLSLFSGLAFHGPLVFQGTYALGAIVFVTLFPTFCSFLLQNVAQKRSPPAHASILMSLESVFGALGGIFILNEIFTLRMALGCGLIFVAILMVELNRAR